MFPLFYRSVAVPPGVALLKAYEPKVDLRAGLVDHPETQSIHITSHLHVSASQRYGDKTEASETSSDGPTSESIEAVIKMMSPFTSANMMEVGHAIRDGSMSTDGNDIVMFFNTIVSDE